MKSKNTLTLLTLATASLLTACGSGGGRAPETMPAPAPKLEQDKAPEKGKEQGSEKAPEVAPAPQAPEKKPEAPKQDNKPQQPEVAPPAPQAPEKKPEAPKQDNKPQQPEVAPPAPQAPEKKPEAPKQDNKPKQPEVAPAPQAPEKKPEAPKPDNKPQQPDVKPQNPKPDAEKQQPMPEVKKTDQEVFPQLRLEHKGGLIVDNLFKLVFDNGTRKVGLEIVPPHNFTGSPKVETLRDLDGTLVGYYGYARVSERKRDESRADGDKEYAADRHFFIQHSDPNQRQAPTGLGDITYKGKMFYQYDNNRNGAQEAEVLAKYSGKDETLSMDILGKEGQWRLHADKSPSSSTAVGFLTNGLVSGHLAFKGNADDKFRPDATFTGGFYGKNSSVLTGRGRSEDKDNGWEGVIGATAVTPKK